MLEIMEDWARSIPRIQGVARGSSERTGLVQQFGGRCLSVRADGTQENIVPRVLGPIAATFRFATLHV